MAAAKLSLFCILQHTKKMAQDFHFTATAAILIVLILPQTFPPCTLNTMHEFSMCKSFLSQWCKDQLHCCRFFLTILAKKISQLICKSLISQNLICLTN